VWSRTRSRLSGTGRILLILVLAIAGGTTVVWTQAPSIPASAMVAAGADSDVAAVRLLVGRSTVLDVGSAIARVSLTSADIADALVTSPNQLLINGKTPGTISMFVWDRGGAIRRYEVIVQRDLARLSEQVRQLFPNENISVESNGKNVVLTGTVSNKEMIEKAVNVAAGYVDKREEVTTLLQLAPNAPSNQVLLRVRFAEVSRSALTELGASFAANGVDGGRWFGRTTTGQFPAPEWDQDGKLVFSDFLNLFLFDAEEHLTAVIKALQNRGLFQSLAEPNLVSESGKEASFLAGGEFPIPIVQGTGTNMGISVEYKEFGIRLNFTPTVNGDRVHLKVRPEVSTLDFGNAVILNGFRIPALTTRRTETELELQNRQTFAIAGLMNNSVASTLQKIPGIGDIPILGYLFRSKAAQKNQTELVVMITPEILPNNSPGVTRDLPPGVEEYMPPVPQRQTRPQPPAAFTPERPTSITPQSSAAQSAQPVAQQQTSQPKPGAKPAPAPSPASAAATVSSLTPAAPRVVQPTTAPGPTSAIPAAATAVTAKPAAAPAAVPAPAATATPASAAVPAAAAPAVTRPLTSQEKKALEEARRAEMKRAEEEAKAARRAKAAADKQAQKDREEQESRAREQAKRDADAARRLKEAEARQEEIERERQKAVAEAAARLKAAEAAYQAELAKQGRQ
jgi:pilus assembly protein CpaC